jgi:hypothetical protein
MMAHLQTPDGRSVTRFGVVNQEVRSSWRGADRGATVELDSNSRTQLRDSLSSVVEAGKRHKKQARTDMVEADQLQEKLDRGQATDQDLARLEELSGRIPAEGDFYADRVPTDWGEVVLEAHGIDDGDGGWDLVMFVRHRDSTLSDGRYGKFVGGPLDGEWVENYADVIGPAEIRRIVAALETPAAGWASQLAAQMG